MTMPVIKRLTLIGLGLIGSSIARAACSVGAAETIVAFDRDVDVRAKVDSLGLADDVAETLAEAVQDADLVILCVPVGAMASTLEAIAPHLEAGAIVSDVGSVKTNVAKAMAAHVPNGVYGIPAHPVAGTEQSGPEAGFASLFDQRWCIITPGSGTNQDAQDKLEAFWRALGSRIEIMTPEHHDLVLAITSHIPHLIAYNIVGTASDLEDVTKSEVIKYSAGGFRDFTRIAASDPTMWRDVFLNNKEAVLEMLGRFTEDLTALQRAIRRDDGEALFDLFSRTRAIRQTIIDAGQETPEADFGRSHSEDKA